MNRGVHEPLEEFVFQEMIKHKQKNFKLNQNETIPGAMLELGSYWAHYSMWFAKYFPNSDVYCVESDLLNLECGKNNFSMNNFKAKFIHAYVCSDDFMVDKFFVDYNIKHISVLHSDIQGYELEMLFNAKNTLINQLIDYIFISTHSQKLHYDILNILK